MKEEMENKDRNLYLNAAMVAFKKLKEYITSKEEERLEEQLKTIAEYLSFTKSELKEYLKDINENYS